MDRTFLGFWSASDLYVWNVKSNVSAEIEIKSVITKFEEKKKRFEGVLVLGDGVKQFTLVSYAD